jgi:hypothetical protein
MMAAAAEEDCVAVAVFLLQAAWHDDDDDDSELDWSGEDDRGERWQEHPKSEVAGFLWQVEEGKWRWRRERAGMRQE